MVIRVQGLRNATGPLRPGDVVLMKYTSLDTPALVFYQVAKWGFEEGYTVVVSDVLNSMYLYKQHLKMMGIDTSFMDELYSIKWGGNLKVGNVVRTVPIGSPAVEVIGEYRRALDELLQCEGNILELFTGSEKVFIPYLQSIEDIVVILNSMLPHLGHERMISFYLLNSDIAEGISGLVARAFEGVATVIVNCRTERSGTKVSYEVVKRIGP